MLAIWIVRVFATGVLIYSLWSDGSETWDPCDNGMCYGMCE